MITILYVFGGLLALLAGGEALVRGAVALAKRVGLSELLIGLTVVALGTSAPELVVSVDAVLQNHPDIAVGNVIGSNIANVLLVLGATALVAPLIAHHHLIKRDLPAMTIATAMAVVFCWDGHIVQVEGALLLATLALYIVISVKTSKKGEVDPVPAAPIHSSLSTIILFLLLGGGLLATGAYFLVEGASELARLLGVSEAVIGATVVAVGSSSPELVTCLLAARRMQPDIAIGNVVGSNIMNILLVLGTTGALTAYNFAPSLLALDIWVMVGAALLLHGILFWRPHISRFTGGVLFCGYGVYIVSQFI